MPLQDYTRYVFGDSISMLDPDILPEENNIIRYVVFCHDVSLAEYPNMRKKARKASVVKIVASAVMEIWKKKSLPTISDKAVFNAVGRLMDQAQYVKESRRRHENDLNYIQGILSKHNKIFDISKKPDIESEPMDVTNVEPVAESMDAIELNEPEQEEVNLGTRKRRRTRRWAVESEETVGSMPSQVCILYENIII